MASIKYSTRRAWNNRGVQSQLLIGRGTSLWIFTPHFHSGAAPCPENGYIHQAVIGNRRLDEYQLVVIILVDSPETKIGVKTKSVAELQAKVNNLTKQEPRNDAHHMIVYHVTKR